MLPPKVLIVSCAIIAPMTKSNTTALDVITHVKASRVATAKMTTPWEANLTSNAFDKKAV
jgi:hypothetical protein